MSGAGLVRRVALAAAVAAGWLAVAPRARAGAAPVAQPDLAAVRGDLSRDLLGRGWGVRVGVLDSGVDAAHPALLGSVAAALDLTGGRGSDDLGAGPGHGTGVASVYGGHSAVFTGLTPKAGLINVRVGDGAGRSTEARVGAGLFYAARSGARVVNLSLGSPLADGPFTERLGLLADYVAENWGVTVVASAGNENASAVAYSPGGALNVCTVGAVSGTGYGTVAGYSNYALRADRRTKPDLVAPGEVAVAAANWESSAAYHTGSGTSYATPIAGGVLAQMAGYGQDHGLSTHPQVLRAVLMTAATKIKDYDGSSWTPRSSFTSTRLRGLRIDKPLDDEQGAGRVDAVAAYDVYAKRPSAGEKLVDWAQGRMRRGRSFQLALGRRQGGERVDATLAWYRHVAASGGGSKVTEAYRFEQAADLAEFSLALLKDGAPVVTSDSPVDNVEHLSFELQDAGDYVLRVYRGDGGGLDKETFAVAARVLAAETFAPAGTLPAAPVGAAPAGADVSGGAWSAVSVPEPSLAWAAAASAWAFLAASGRARRRAGRAAPASNRSAL